MKEEIQVSVVVCTYNPDLEKLVRTLYSIVNQKGLSFEIVVTDDGSTIDYFKEIRKLFKIWGFQNYVLNKMPENVGTVKNFFAGLLRAKGKFIKAISPGDLLYDDYVLKSLYDFSKLNKCKLVFGDGIYYNADISLKLYKNQNYPIRPSIFEKNVPLVFQRHFIAWKLGILGATFFWERECAVECITWVSGYVKYVEDLPSIGYASIQRKRIIHYPHPVIWYEFGNGISTTDNYKWKRIVLDEIDEAFIQLQRQYHDKRLWDWCSLNVMDKSVNSSKRIFHMLKHPYYMLIRLLTGVFFKVEYTATGFELEMQLQNILEKASLVCRKLLEDKDCASN